MRCIEVRTYPTLDECYRREIKDVIGEDYIWSYDFEGLVDWLIEYKDGSYRLRDKYLDHDAFWAGVATCELLNDEEVGYVLRQTRSYLQYCGLMTHGETIYDDHVYEVQFNGSRVMDGLTYTAAIYFCAYIMYYAKMQGDCDWPLYEVRVQI